MPRISLVEAYNNRDVIAWLVKHQDAIDEMMNILQNINPDGDLTNIVLKTGDQTIDGVKTFIGQIVADCDIIQNGAAYETHAEQIFSHNDYLVMRDGALNGLAAGTYSGLQIKKYDGTKDFRMVVDNTGTMRVGDINDERPLLLRAEANTFTDGDILEWHASTQAAQSAQFDVVPTYNSHKLINSGSIYTALTGKEDLWTEETVAYTVGTGITINASYSTVIRYGRIVFVTVAGITAPAGTNVLISGLPKTIMPIRAAFYVAGGDAVAVANANATSISIYSPGAVSDGSITLTYLTE